MASEGQGQETEGLAPDVSTDPGDVSTDPGDNPARRQGHVTNATTILNDADQPLLLTFKIKNTSKHGSADRAKLWELAQAGNVARVSDLTLKSLRRFVHNLGQRDHFCFEDETTIADDQTSLDSYVKYTKTNLDAVKSADKEGPVFLTVHLLRNKHRPATEDELQKAAPPKIDLSIADRTGDDVTVDKMRGLSDRHKFDSLSADDYTAIAAEDGNIHPADLTAAQWDVVIKNNSLLHGFYADQVRGTIHRAPLAAFRLRKKGADAIPLFHVHDDSSVTVQEIASSKQRSAVENSFRATDFQASASGGFAGMTAGASGGFSNDTSSGGGSHRTETGSTLRVSYNFPRVALYLEAECLTLTDECLDMLQRIHSATGPKQDRLIERFECAFGQIFRTVVKLGGCLYSEKLSASVAGESIEHKKESMKIAAGASVNTIYGSASMSFSHSTGSNSVTESTSADQSQSLAWQARGGDTLLCSNPKAWVPTVQNRYNWRVIDSEHPETMEVLFDRIKEIDNLPHGFPTTMMFRPAPQAHSFFNRPTTTESYLFTGAYYRRIMAAPSTCVTFGPARHVHNWPSLVTVGFDSVDATLPVPGSDDEIYVFSGLQYAIIKASPEDNRVVHGPVKITDEWLSLAQARFDRVDSCMRVPGEGREHDAYFFRGEEYVRVTKEKIVYGPSKIAGTWPSLANAGFDVVDAILPAPGGNGLTYFFRGSRYAVINIDEKLKDEIEFGPTSIADDGSGTGLFRRVQNQRHEVQPELTWLGQP